MKFLKKMINYFKSIDIVIEYDNNNNKITYLTIDRELLNKLNKRN